MSENWSDDLCKCGHRREFHSYLQGSRSYLGACDFDGRCVNGCKRFEDVPERDWKSENFCNGDCGRPQDEHEYLDVSNMTRLYVCPTAERAAKWKKVEPTTVIPAGQPYRVEYPEMLPECLASDPHGILAVDYDGLNLPFKPFQRSNFVETSRWFIDSSWKPPLVFPTTPGSLIEATPFEMIGWNNTKRLWWRRKDGYWLDQNDDLIKDSRLILNRVLFDAGSDDD